MGKINLDWGKLRFDYVKTDYRYISYWKDGKWDEGSLVTDNVLHISEGSTALHYGQQQGSGIDSDVQSAFDGRSQQFHSERSVPRARL